VEEERPPQQARTVRMNGPAIPQDMEILDNDRDPGNLVVVREVVSQHHACVVLSRLIQLILLRRVCFSVVMVNSNYTPRAVVKPDHVILEMTEHPITAEDVDALIGSEQLDVLRVLLKTPVTGPKFLNDQRTFLKIIRPPLSMAGAASYEISIHRVAFPNYRSNLLVVAWRIRVNNSLNLF
jgi:hypothetical protein